MLVFRKAGQSNTLPTSPKERLLLKNCQEIIHWGGAAREKKRDLSISYILFSRLLAEKSNGLTILTLLHLISLGKISILIGYMCSYINYSVDLN